jgi:hypothetical protein
MAGTIIVDTINSSVASTPPVFQANGTEVGTLCRAWVNFNGTGTVAIRASFNVSSITDNGTGDYTVNFTNAMPDANYSANVTSGQYNGRFASIRNTSSYDVAASVLSSSIRVMIASSTTVPDNQDLNTVCVSVFR